MNEETKLPDGLQLAIQYCNIGTTHDRRNFAEDAIRAEHAQRLTLQHHAADQVWRIADLEVKCITLKELHDAAVAERDELAQRHRSQHDADSAELRQLCADRDAAREERDNLIDAMREEIDEGLRLRELGGALPDENITAMTERVIKERDALRVKVSDLERAAVKRREISDGVEAELVDECDTLRILQSRAESERDELRAKYDELLVALHGIGAALGIPEGDRSPYSVTCGVLERVNRLAEIDAQEPVAKIHTDGYWTARRGYDPLSDGKAFLSVYARPVPAQAVPDGWRPATEDPTDDGLYWVLIGDQPHVARFSNRTSTARWWSAYGIPRAVAEEPTHWMPIPDAPEAAR